MKMPVKIWRSKPVRDRLKYDRDGCRDAREGTISDAKQI